MEHFPIRGLHNERQWPQSGSHLVRRSPQRSHRAASEGIVWYPSIPTEGNYVFAAYVTINILASLFTAIASITYLVNHDYPREQMEMKRLPLTWMPRLGLALGAGSLGLLLGFAVPVLGTLASFCLVLYFIGAFIAHMRVGSRKLTGWAIFFVTVVAAFVVNVAYHGLW